MPNSLADPASQPLERTGASALAVKRSLLFTRNAPVGVICLGFDVICWWIGYLLMLRLRNHAMLPGDDGADSSFQTSVCLVQLAASAACLFIVGGYDRRTDFLSLSYMSEHCIAMVGAGVVGGLLIYAGAAYTQTLRPSRGVFLASLISFVVLSLISRRTLCQALQARRSRSYFVVLGAGERVRHFYRSYLASPNRERLRFVALTSSSERIEQPVDPTDPAEPRIKLESLAQLASLAADSSGIIVADGAHLLPTDLLDWLTRLHYEEVPVYTLETFYEQHWRRVPTYAIDPTWPLQMGRQLTSQSSYSYAKRLLDLFAAGWGLLVLSPLFLSLGLLVWVESGRPVFFRQQRIGRDRRPFSLCKFRSMYVRTSGDEGSLYTGTKDVRITKIGRWLRRLRLDELPQLWNVFKGDMSLIGPRAEWDQLVDLYEKQIRCYHFRHLVKPGITGWAQVNYPYGASTEDAEQKLKYDLYYIRSFSLRLDAMIVLKTLHIMLWGKGQ